MKKIIASLALASSLFGDITPNFPAMTPEWATNDDIEVAYVIMGESRGESLLGQAFVADVIYTRMKLKNKTAYEVVIEPNQFEGYHDGEISDHVWKLVLKLKLGLDIIKDAEFTQFRAYKLTNIPTWAKEPVVVGNHIFFTE
jgi:spore germination cell wall hydrolase CwlJ-like protein